MKKTEPRWWAAAGLIAVAVLWRWVNWQYSIAPNLEVVTASALVAAAFLGRRWALAVPMMIMAVSDVLIGNSLILLFTWSAFAITGLTGLLLRRLVTRPAWLMLASVGMGIGGSIFFFVWTNFGVWLLGDGTMYAKTWAGLMESYVMGLPFFRTMLVGNLVVVPIYMGTAIMAARLRRMSELGADGVQGEALIVKASRR